MSVNLNDPRIGTRIKPIRFVCDESAEDLACENQCQVCRYINFLEWARSVAPAESTIMRDEEIEAWLREKRPGLL